MRKVLSFGIIFLFIGLSITPVSSTNLDKESTLVNIDGNTLYVGGNGPGNYSSIQDAIDDAVDGDTVFVYDDSSPYNETIRIEKSINLQGEHRETTIITGDGKTRVVTCIANQITVQSFTIENAQYGIYLDGTENCVISENIVKDNYIGISLYNASDNLITENTAIHNNRTAIDVTHHSQYNIVSFNNASNNDLCGILFDFSPSNNTIANNTVVNNGVTGMRFYDTSNNIIYGNRIVNNWQQGLLVELSSNINISRNTIAYSYYGIYLYIPDNITIYENTIENCTIGIYTLNWPPNQSYMEDSNRAQNDKTNFIIRNNFIKNKIHVLFIFSTYFQNVWEQNYWGRQRLLPKPIIGIKKIGPLFGFPARIIFDLRPAQEPYDIGV